MSRFMWLSTSALMVVVFLGFSMDAMAATVIAGKVEYGLAARYGDDEGIEAHPAVIAATGFESSQWAAEAFDYSRDLPQGYEYTTDPALVLSGNGSLQIQQTQGTHQPSEFHPSIPDSDTVFVRWYRRYEAGYDWTQHKMPGVYAKESDAQNGTAGVPPTGCDKYSCKLYVDNNARPAFYSYHPDQEGPYGDGIQQNVGTPVVLETERWYCFEMMLKSNTPGQRDGELKMWIDGILKGHVEGLRFRTCETLKINEFTHSAYVGGNWVSERDQKLWDDNLVIATEYIGPMPDKTAPMVQSVQILESHDQMAVGFDRQVDEVEALNLDLYSIDQEVQVLSAEMAPDFQSVILKTSPLTPGSIYTLGIGRISTTAPGAEETGIEAVFKVPEFEVLVDFGATESANTFGSLDWVEVIKDVYTHYADLGPGGTTIGVGENRSYNFQGVRGARHAFTAEGQIRVTWYNASSESITFFPNISVDDPDRIDDGQEGGWHPLAAWFNTDLKEVVIPASSTVTSAFSFDADTAGNHELVNINVNHGSNSILVCDKIVIDDGGAVSLIRAQRIDADAEPEDDADDPIDPDPTPGDNTQDTSSSNSGGGCFVDCLGLNGEVAQP